MWRGCRCSRPAAAPARYHLGDHVDVVGTGPVGPGASVRLPQSRHRPATTSSVSAYWVVASDGGIFSFGGAPFYGSTGNIHLNKPVVGMAATSPTDCGGYWEVASDGGIFDFGNAQFYGSTGNIRLNQPIVGMAATPSGNGYWLVAADGGIFAFGDAGFYGSIGGHPPQPADRRHGLHARRPRATGWWPPTAGSSPSATPGSTGRPGTSTSPSRSWA